MSAYRGNPIPLVTCANGFPKSVPPAVLRVVAAAIRKAWQIIESDPDFHLVAPGPGAPEEDIYSSALCHLMQQFLHEDPSPVPGFSSAVIDAICRCESIENFDGSSLNKNPDLVIRLANGSLVATRKWLGLFIEAKVVSLDRTMDGYATEGVGRFVRGEYSWAMQDSLMLAYQKSRQRPLASLEKRLSSDAALAAKKAGDAYLEIRAEFLPLTALSTHERSWRYLGGDAPGPIRVWHLWDLNVPARTSG